MGSVSLCRDEDNSSPHLPCQADPLSGSDGCCLVPLLSPGGGSPTAVVSSGTQQRLIPPMTSSPRSALGPLGGHSVPGLVVMGGALAELLPGASAVVTEARGPFGARHRWSLWIDGRWPYPKPRFLEGAAPWDPPFAGVVHGVWTLHPRATCRSLPAPSRAPGRIPCVRTGAGGV
ncbi:hypothetical protein N7530_012956 [Penicillium desertorum]|uniref:Uncharacterized protein n=2 Tax=Penicillium desertorum TaxID=1303715 RepID=A0A9W9WD51_9EURO|nr:hypothetical protein N7530_012956 [Penicillium desertorum]